ncbi:MAG: fadK 2 [Pseudonocardiales bacterium]|nr:fadK 2 [Pseudonocardiales bacterium]
MIEGTVWEFIQSRADSSPENVMFVDEYGRTLTFGQYRDRAEQVAAGLLRLGVTAGTRVSWQLPTGLEAAVLIAALARLGAVQNPIIASLREHELDLIVEQCEPEFIVVPSVWRGFDFAAMVGPIAEKYDSTVLVCHITDLTAESGFSLPVGDVSTLPPPETVGPTGERPVRWIFYSSGTTARPKGAMHTDIALLAAGENLRIGTDLRASDVYPMAYPISHIGGPAFVCAQLSVGARILLLERWDPQTSPPLMAAHGSTVLGSGLPFFAAYLAQQRDLAGPMFPDLRVCAAGGAPTPPELHFEVKEQLGGRGIATGYGLTEFPIATCINADDGDDVMAYTVGRPGPGVEVKVVDAHGRPVAPGIEGEILLNGPQRFVGYVDSTLDAAALDADGYFRTGDLGSVDDRGLIRITGRLKDVIIRNGENISAAEVEQALLKHPSIGDVAVIGIPDVKTGERVLAFIEPAGPDAVTMAVLTEACRAAGLATYKIPEQLEIIAAIPRNSLGKILKTELRALAGG